MQQRFTGTAYCSQSVEGKSLHFDLISVLHEIWAELFIWIKLCENIRLLEHQHKPDKI